MELLSAQCQSYWSKQDELMGVIKLSMVKLTPNEFRSLWRNAARQSITGVYHSIDFWLTMESSYLSVLDQWTDGFGVPQLGVTTISEIAWCDYV